MSFKLVQASLCKDREIQRDLPFVKAFEALDESQTTMTWAIY